MRRNTSITRSLFVLGVSGLLCASVSNVAAQTRSRLTQPVDNRARTTVRNSSHPMAIAPHDRGRIPAETLMARMTLILKSSPEQDAALEKLIEDQQNPSSQHFRRWLTPEQFGEQFGPSHADLTAVKSWLESHGFTVHAVANGRRSLEFSGSAEQVESAFHTEMHRYEVDGESHIANSADFSIPAALAPVVHGVASLHDFRPKPSQHVIPQPQFNTGGRHGLMPYDFAAIYNLTPLWNAGWDGKGQTIVVVGNSNIHVADIARFRVAANLPPANLEITINGADPGITGNETEADLDIQWAGAVAKSARIQYVVTKDAQTDGVTLSSIFAVNRNLAPIISSSYGSCELAMGGATQLYYDLWKQAAVQGISVFVAAGDGGSALCDFGRNFPARTGLGVNGFASTPYNVAVGGTEFNDFNNPANYWNANNDAHNASAKGYIPERPWNESAAMPGGNGLWAGSGGSSMRWQRPNWQFSPNMQVMTPTRMLPDVSLTAASHDGYLIFTRDGVDQLVGGTSASTPAFAGIMAILNQSAGGRQGNPNPQIYFLSWRAPQVFHDVVGGNNRVPCMIGTPGCAAAPVLAPGISVTVCCDAVPGYDMATGLGSVDIWQLWANWENVPHMPWIESVSPNSITASLAGQVLGINGLGLAHVKVQITSNNLLDPLPTQIVSASATFLQVAAVFKQIGLYRVIVTDQDTGHASNVLNFLVTASPNPIIDTLTPNRIAASAAVQILKIDGLSFGAHPQVTIGGLATQIVSSTDSSIQVKGVFNQPANYLVSVKNLDNGAVSNGVVLSVTAAPAGMWIDSLNPNPIIHSDVAQNLTIKGAGFGLEGPMSQVVIVNAAGFHFYPSSNWGDTQIVAHMIFNVPGNYTVYVTDGFSTKKSNSVVLAVR